MTLLTCGFEDGVDGNTVAAGTGDADPLDLLTLSGGTTKYESEDVILGNLALKNVGDGAGAFAIGWRTAVPDITTEVYGRLYFKLPALGSTYNICRYEDATTAVALTIDVLTSGNVRLLDRTGGAKITLAAAYTANTWARVEWRVDCNDSGTATSELRFYADPHSTTPSASNTNATGQYRAQISGGYIVGNVQLDAVNYFDGFGFSDEGWFGPLIVAQKIRPISDISDGSWLPSTGSDLYAVLDEETASDADFIYSSQSPTSSDICEVKFTTAEDPLSSDDHIIRYRYAKDQASGDQINLTVRLVQGTTVIASWNHTNIGNTPTTAEQTLSGAEADSITDYSDLRLRFEAIKP